MLRKSKTCWNIKNRKKTFKNTRKNINNMKKIWMKILPRRKSKKNVTITQQNMKNRKNMKNTYIWVEVGGWGNPSCTGCTHWNRKMPGLILCFYNIFICSFSALLICNDMYMQRPVISFYCGNICSEISTRCTWNEEATTGQMTCRVCSFHVVYTLNLDQPFTTIHAYK